MLQGVMNALKVKDLRKRIFFVLAMVAVYRIGAHIPVPGVDASIIRQFFEGGDILGFLDMFAGGALSDFTIFAMSITPYITASIIMQLLQVVIPKLEELARQGQEGRKKIAQYVRYATIGLALVQGTGLTYMIQQQGAVVNPGTFSFITILITLTSGTAFLMWLGELITDKGIGNGISIIIFVSILSRFPIEFAATLDRMRVGAINFVNLLLFLLVALGIIAGVIFVQQGERRIPVQYSKRVVGRRIYGGRSTHIPMKVNQAGVIPIIFAVSVLLFPATIAQFLPFGWAQALANLLDPSSAFYLITYGLLIIFFTYFYTAITFNPVEVADNMRKNGGFIPGRRPGQNTAQYLDRVLTRITLSGAIFLALVAIVPTILIPMTGVQFQFGGTSILIVTGVALETMKQIESHLLMRHYEGFLK